MTIKIGIAGMGAIGNAVYESLTQNSGIENMELCCISDIRPHRAEKDFPNLSFEELAIKSDLIIECLPASVAPDLAKQAFKNNKDILMISSAALLLYPQILEDRKQSPASRIFLPSGALSGIDGVKAMKEMGIKSSKIASTKPPKGLSGAPYILDNNIDIENISEKTRIFAGNALEAAKGFPANVNVAATLSLAGIGAELTRVEVWADPDAISNCHEITVKTEYSTMHAKIENMPDPANPKSSVLAAQSIVANLRDMSRAVVIG